METQKQSDLEKWVKRRKVSNEELGIILKEIRSPTNIGKTKHAYHFDSDQEVHRFGIVGDMHIGSKYHDRKALEIYMQKAKDWGVEFLLDVGDSVDGSFNMHPGMWREQSALGFSDQMEAYANDYPNIGVPTYRINGNHDRSFVKDNGSDPGIEIARIRPDITHLGDDQADFYLGKTKIRMLHPDGGASYADSYRLQKIVEAYGPEEKPHFLLVGHYHRIGQLYMRGVHAFLTGTFQGQSNYAKRKALPSRKGSWLIEFSNTRDGTVTDLVTRLIPFYK